VLAGCGFDTGPNFHTHFPDPPDTTNLFEFANFMDAEQIALVIAEETTLKNGKKRLKGIVAVPQDGDDFRGHMLDNVYWRGETVVEGDFRGDF